MIKRVQSRVDLNKMRAEHEKFRNATKKDPNRGQITFRVLQTSSRMFTWKGPFAVFVWNLTNRKSVAGPTSLRLRFPIFSSGQLSDC
jgi:hypothetical protein